MPPASQQAPRRGRSRIRSLRRIALAGLALLAIVGLALRPRLESWLVDAAREALAKEGLILSVRGVELHLLRLRLDVTDLVLDRAPDAPGRLAVTIPYARLDLSWRALVDLRNGRIRIDRLLVERPRVETDGAFLRARTERDERGEPLGLDVLARHLRVTGGVWIHEDRAIPLEVEMTRAELRASLASDGRTTTGDVQADVHAARNGDRPGIRAHVRTQFRLRRESLELLEAELTSEPLTVTGRGTVELGRVPAVRASVEIDGDLGVLRRTFVPDTEPVSGRLHGELDLSRSDGPWTASGPVEFRDLRTERFAIPRLTADLRFDGTAATLTEVDASVLGGRVRGKVVLPVDSPARADSDLTVTDVDARGLFSWIGVPLPIRGSVSGAVRLSGEAMRRETWNGAGSFSLAALPPDGDAVPASGTGEFRIEAGRLALSAPRVSTPATDFALDATLDLTRHPAAGSVALRGSTVDAARTQIDVHRILTAVDVEPPEIALRPVRGTGPLHARFTLGGEPEVEIDLDLADGSWGPVAFDRATVAIRSRSHRIDISELDVRIGTSRLRGSLAFDPEPFRLAAVDLEGQDVDLAQVAELTGASTDLVGRGTGTLRATRAPAGLAGEGALRLVDGHWLGEPYSEASARLVVDGDAIRFEDATVRSAALDLRGRASLDLSTGQVDAAIETGLVDLERLETVRGAGAPVAARLAVSGPLRVDDEGPHGELTIGTDELTLGTLSLGSVEGRIDLRPAEVELQVKGVDPGGFRGTAVVGLDATRPFRAELALDGLSVEVPGDGELDVRLVTGGTFVAQGRLSEPHEWDVRGTFDDASIHVGARSYAASAAVPLRVADGKLDIGPFEIANDPVRLEGRLGYVIDTGEIDARLDGTTDLSSVAFVMPDLRAQGRVTLGIHATGTSDAPRFDGSLKLEDGRVRHLGLPYVLQATTAEIALHGSTAEIKALHGVLGGGEIDATGSVELGRAGISAFRLSILGQGVRLELPEGFDGVYDSRLTIEGGPDRIEVRGHAEILRGLWSEELERPQFFGSTTREYAAEEGSELAAHTFLDLDLHADGRVWVRNRLSTIESAVDLRIGGTLDRPQVTGRVFALEGGRIEYRGVRYQVRSGTLDFTNPDRIDPFVTLEAETTVSGYEIQLRVTGTPSRLSYELASSPSLSTQDIIALLATGRTFSDAEGGGGRTEFTGDVAANYFAGVLTDPFEQQLASLVGLDTFRVDPLTIDRQDPTTRVTIGKDIRDDLSVLYSHRSDQVEEDLYQVEWRANRRATVTAERATNGGVGADLYYTHRYWWRKPVPESASPLPSPTADQAADASRLGAVRIEVAPPGEPGPSELFPRLPLRSGDRYHRAALYTGVEALRSALVRKGYLESEVTAQATSSAPGVTDVVYHVRAGRRYEIVFVGVRPKEERKLRPALESMWSGSLFVGDLYDDSVDAIRSFFQSRGHYAVDVEYELEAGESPTLRFVVDRGAVVRVSRVILAGTAKVGEERVRRQMLTRPPGILGSRAFDPGVLEADLAAIRNLYRSEGYLGVRIDEPEIRLSMDGESVEITLRIEEGIRYTLRSLEFSDVPGVPPEQLVRWSGLEIGKPVSRQTIADGEAALRRALDHAGRSDAGARAVPTLSPDGGVDLRFEVTAGPESRVAAIRVEGNFLTREGTIREALGLKVGDVVTHESLARAQRALYRLGTLQSVRVDDTPLDQADDRSRLLTVRVTESRPLRLAIGIGYNTESKVNLSLGTSFDNVAGRARSIGMRAILNQDLRNFQVFGRTPKLFGSNTPGLASLVWETDEQNPGFDTESWSVSLRADHHFDRKWMGFLRYSYQLIDVYNIVDPIALQQEQLEDAQLGSVEASLTYDSRDDPVLPTRGLRGTVNVAVFAEPFLSEFSYLRGTVELSRLWSLPHNLVFVTVARAGIEDRFAGTLEVPISERFFAGGSSTVRGFETDFLGPVSDGVPTGGEGLFVLNEEIRFPLFGSLRGVAFYDLGNVYRRLSDYDPFDVRHVLGLGVRYETPIGPLRVEYGWKLDRQPEETRGQFFFSIGNAF